MATRRILLPWTTQPQVSVRPAAQLLRDMSVCVNYGVGNHNVITGEYPTHYAGGGTGIVPGPAGMGSRPGSNVNNAPVYPVPALGANNGPCTVLLVFGGDGDTTASQRGLLSLAAAGTPTSDIPWLYAFATDSTIGVYYDDTTKLSIARNPYARPLSALCIAVNGPAGSIAACIDGALIGTAGIGSGMSRARGWMYVGSGYGGTALVKSYAAAHWARALSVPEMLALTRDPWSLFEPQAIYVPRASGAPAYTHPMLSNARMIWTGPGVGQPAIDYTW